MLRRRHGLRGRRRWRAGVWLAAVAVLVQLLVAAVVPPDGIDAAQADWLTANAICHAGAPAPADHQPKLPHHAPGCLLCPLCQAMVQAGLVPAPPVPARGLPAPVRVRLAMAPAGAAPPAGWPGPAYPRGPPAPV